MTTIKDRVLQISDYKGIAKQKFFKELGLSYANFKGIQKKSALNSDAIDKILTSYSEINYEWLISGKGSMIKEEKPYLPSHLIGKPETEREKKLNKMFTKHRVNKETANSNDPFTASLQDHITTLKENNQLLKEKVTFLNQQLANCNCQKTTEKVLKVAEGPEKYTTKKDK